MSRYFFDFIHGDCSTNDTEWHTWDNHAETLADAVQVISQVLEMDSGSDREISCLMRNDKGALVFTVALTLELCKEGYPQQMDQSDQLRSVCFGTGQS